MKKKVSVFFTILTCMVVFTTAGFLSVLVFQSMASALCSSPTMQFSINTTEKMLPLITDKQDKFQIEPVNASAVTTDAEYTTKPVDTVSDSQNSPVILQEASSAGQAYLDKIIFLGDSTTYHLIHYHKLSGGENTKQIWTTSLGTLTLAYANSLKILYPETGEELLIKEAASLKKPEILIITLGVNGVSFMDETRFKKTYTMLIEDITEVSPDTIILLQSIFPRGITGLDQYSKITQEMIDTANGWVLSVAETCGVYYLDTQSVLKGTDGYAECSIIRSDGLHFNSEGYDIILQYIMTHPYPGYEKTED